jgi:hypothetical protein
MKEFNSSRGVRDGFEGKSFTARTLAVGKAYASGETA